MYAYLPKASRGPDCSLCQAHSGPWASCLTTLIYTVYSGSLLKWNCFYICIVIKLFLPFKQC